MQRAKIVYIDLVFALNGVNFLPIIRQLSPSVVNKIAAGEVIERPASVVKELLENSIDSGATRIDITVEQGGSDLIRIVDNGCGMAADQLPLAVAPHATSKITDADDLFRVSTLGFRGEALASIAEVSRTLIRSRPNDAESGAELLIDGGKQNPVSPCGAPHGTMIEIRDLFFNTPVRKKFLKTTQTEMGHLTEVVTRSALAYPHIHFTLLHGTKSVYDLPPTDEWSERIGTFYGRELADDLIWVESRAEGIWLRGYAARPSQTRGNNRMQYLFLNGRSIRDRSLQHALSEAYRGLVMTGRFPIAFLQIDMPPELVDVNVHPTKMEVRFQDGGRIYNQLLGTLRSKFLSSDMTAKLQTHAGQNAMNPNAFGKMVSSQSVGSVAASVNTPFGRATSDAPWEADARREEGLLNPAQSEAQSIVFGSGSSNATVANISGAFMLKEEVSRDYSGAIDPNQAMLVREQMVAWAKGELTQETNTSSQEATNDGAINGNDSSQHAPLGTIPAYPEFLSGDDVPSYGHAPLELLPFTRPDGEKQVTPIPYPAGDYSQTGNSRSSTNTNINSLRSSAIQIHNKYLVAETSDGLVVIDQHALHERILYEQLRTKILSGAVESQQLLVPEPVDFNAADSAAVLGQKEILEKIGIGIEPFGGGTILVNSYPAILANFRPAEVLKDVVDQLLSEGKTPQRRDILDELLHMISCKAAIKAGDRLSQAEVTTLVEQRNLFQDSHHCPHGRPTMLNFSREELDKQFKRT